MRRSVRRWPGLAVAAAVAMAALPVTPSEALAYRYSSRTTERMCRTETCFQHNHTGYYRYRNHALHRLRVR